MNVRPRISLRSIRATAASPSAAAADTEFAIDRCCARACRSTRSAPRFAARHRRGPRIDGTARPHRGCDAGRAHGRRGGHGRDRNARRRRRWYPRRVAGAAGVVDRIVEAAGTAHAPDTADTGILGEARRRHTCGQHQSEYRRLMHEIHSCQRVTNESRGLAFRFADVVRYSSMNSSSSLILSFALYRCDALLRAPIDPVT